MSLLRRNFEGRYFVKNVIKHMREAGSQAPSYRFGYQPIFSAQVGSRYYTTLCPDLKKRSWFFLKLFTLILNILEKCILYISNIAMGALDPKV